MLVLDNETDRQLPTDHITEQDTDKCFAPPDEQEDGNNTETISSTSTSDYEREEVEASLATVAEAFHMTGSEYEWLCVIVSHMTKVQATSVISRLQEGKSQSRDKTRYGTMEPPSEAPRVPETSQVSEMSQVSEAP